MQTSVAVSRHALRFAAVGLVTAGLLIAPWTLAAPQDSRAPAPTTRPIDQSAEPPAREHKPMQVHYLEIVTPDVDAVCAAYAAALGTPFGQPDAGLGHARTAPLPGGGLVGVRAPLRSNEQPVVRPYWLVDDIKGALAAALAAGGQLAHPPLEIPGHGTFAIYIQAGIEHGLWQR